MDSHSEFVAINFNNSITFSSIGINYHTLDSLIAASNLQSLSINLLINFIGGFLFSV